MDSISTLVLASFLVLHQVKAEYAVLKASTASQSKYFCASYDPDWKDLPTDVSDTPAYEYELVSSEILCGENKSTKYKDHAVLSVRDKTSCSFSKQHQYVQERDATELVIVNYNDNLFLAVAQNPGDYVNSTIPLVVMKKSDFYTMKSLTQPVKIQLYVPPFAAVDSNLAVIWFLAVGAVMVGAYWSGTVAKEQRERLVEIKGTSNNGKASESNEEEPSMRINAVMVFVFVAMICGFLLLVYYLYKYVIYGVIAIFAIASCSGMYECLNALVLKIPLCQCQLPPNSIPLLKSEPFVKSLFVFCFSLAFAICWVIFRNASYGWILQDILGVLFCISLLKNLRLPSMKICTLLLMLLLIYDVFFVFITPLFSASHHSVMIDVATGHKEQLPMVLKVPRIIRSDILVCQRDYSLLGFGDILVPGLFVSFCHSYDLMARTPYRLYYVASSVAYGCGLIITFAALYLMKEGQPALVYLVPCTLGTVILISLIRKEFSCLWNGTYVGVSNLITSDASSSGEEDEPTGNNEEEESNEVENNENRSGEKERLIN